MAFHASQQTNVTSWSPSNPIARSLPLICGYECETWTWIVLIWVVMMNEIWSDVRGIGCEFGCEISGLSSLRTVSRLLYRGAS